MTSDVAADADPNTGAAVYDSFGYGGWVIVGGTSQSSPLLAGIFGLAGNPTEQNGGETFWIKKTKVRHLYPVTVGKNGSCSPNYFCTDGTHEYEDYGGPTGWGTPRGIGQF
jgi:subtilase family serine protease